jgi:transposase
MDIIHPNCAGLDVHKKTVVACVRTNTPEGGHTAVTRTFGTMTANLLEMAAWLASLGVTHVAMEATGVYWKPVWNLLEGRFELMLVNPRDIKQVPGRKTDVKDSQWIAELLRHGLLPASFVPPAAVREQRDLTRRRSELVSRKADLSNRVQKVLEEANIKLASVASDVLGVSGRAMIAALIAGRDDPDFLAGLARGRLREKDGQLRQALQGRVTEHHRFQLRMLMEQVEHLDDQIRRYDARVAEVMARPDDAPGVARSPSAAAEAGSGGPVEADDTEPTRPAVVGAATEAVRRLATIPGIGERTAQVIVAEIGTDMSRFGNAGNLASWAGMCPGNDVSAGVRRTGKTTKGSRWLRTVLVQAAWAASHTKATPLSAAYKSWAKRLSRKKALVALGHKILRLVHALLKGGKDYEAPITKPQLV